MLVFAVDVGFDAVVAVTFAPDEATADIVFFVVGEDDLAGVVAVTFSRVDGGTTELVCTVVVVGESVEVVAVTFIRVEDGVDEGCWIDEEIWGEAGVEDDKKEDVDCDGVVAVTLYVNFFVVGACVVDAETNWLIKKEWNDINNISE